MARTPRILVLVSITIATLFVGSAFAEEPGQVKDLTRVLQTSGVAVDRLQAFEVGGIVLLRGRAVNAEQAEQAGRVAQSLGYSRVANLIQIIAPADDVAIERQVERQLTTHRGLDGCNISVDSREGVVHLAGHVTHELQKDLALQLVKTVDGVRAVQSDLHR